MKNPRLLAFFANLFEISKYAVISLLIICTVIVIVGTPVIVSGQSMMPNFQDKQIIAIERISYLQNGEVERGDVVAAKFPADPKKTRLIKRVIGLPGEKVEAQEGIIYINDQLLNEPYEVVKGATQAGEVSAQVLKNDQYFLVGDNRPNSSDSRIWGSITKNDILGRAFVTIIPINKARIVEHANYNKPLL